MAIEQLQDELLAAFNEQRDHFEIFSEGVEAYFRKDKTLWANPPAVHSIKRRIKDIEHLRDKIARKHTDDTPLTRDNFFTRITDFAGVRVMHLFQNQFGLVHASIMRQIDRGDWYLHEEPKAYTWDPEARDYFAQFGLQASVKESLYTSIHYVVRPRADSEVSCEIQVRTLFEEIWGEVDHLLNYPVPTEILACKEQLRVLSRIVGAGSRLLDSIDRTSRENGENPRKAG